MYKGRKSKCFDFFPNKILKKWLDNQMQNLSLANQMVDHLELGYTPSFSPRS